MAIPQKQLHGNAIKHNELCVGSYLQADAIILYGFSPLPAFSIDLPVKRTAALLTTERQLLSHLIESHQPLCISDYWAA
ncbi:MAG: hypothetical protein ACI97H_000345 [Marinobacter psychrophilus]|jgi:hypothetical protein